MCACADAMDFSKDSVRTCGRKEKRRNSVREDENWNLNDALDQLEPNHSSCLFMHWEGSRHRLLCLEFSGLKQRGTCTKASPSDCSDAEGRRPKEKTATIKVSSGRREATCILSPFSTSRPQQSDSLESVTFINSLRMSYMHTVIFSPPFIFPSSSPHPHPPHFPSNFMSLLFFE